MSEFLSELERFEAGVLSHDIYYDQLALNAITEAVRTPSDTLDDIIEI